MPEVINQIAFQVLVTTIQFVLLQSRSIRIKRNYYTVNPHIGYEAAARVAKAIATGQSVRELCVKNGVLSQEDLELILDENTPGIAGATLLKKN